MLLKEPGVDKKELGRRIRFLKTKARRYDMNVIFFPAKDTFPRSFQEKKFGADRSGKTVFAILMNPRGSISYQQLRDILPFDKFTFRAAQIDDDPEAVSYVLGREEQVRDAEETWRDAKRHRPWWDGLQDAEERAMYAARAYGDTARYEAIKRDVDRRDEERARQREYLAQKAAAEAAYRSKLETMKRIANRSDFAQNYNGAYQMYFKWLDELRNGSRDLMSPMYLFLLHYIGVAEGKIPPDEHVATDHCHYLHTLKGYADQFSGDEWINARSVLLHALRNVEQLYEKKIKALYDKDEHYHIPWGLNHRFIEDNLQVTPTKFWDVYPWVNVFIS